jgi:hypothetical protein
MNGQEAGLDRALAEARAWPRMYRDFKELLSVCNTHRVKYLIEGGYAVSLHAQPRATKDIDILVKPDAENAKVVHAALAKFGAPLEGLMPDDFADRGSFFRMGREPVAVDILSEIQGVDFDSAWQRRIEGVIDTATGLTAHFISGGDLLSARLTAGRPRDIADADAIRKAAESEELRCALNGRPPEKFRKF